MSQSASTVMETPKGIFGRPSLPNNWRWVRLGEICEIIAGQSPPGETYRKTPAGLPFFQGKADFGERHPIARTWCTAPNKIALPDDILISVRAPVGPTNVADVECCIGRGLAAVRPFEIADRDFILASLRFYEGALAKLGSGSTFGAINRDVLESLEIPFPSLVEQKRIAAILNGQMAAVERARAAAEARLKAAKDLPAAYLREMFDTQEAQQWIKEKLGNVSVISGGIQKTPDRKPKSFHRPYLTVRNVQRGYLDLSALERFEITESELDRLRLMQGDILIVEGNGSLDHIGRNALFRGEVPECIHQNHIIRVRLDEKRFIPEFVSRFLNSDSGKAQMIQKAMTTSGLYTLSAGKVAALEIPTPSMKRQREIVEILNEKIPTAENVCEVIKSQIETISSLPAALLRQAFTGKL